MVKLSEILAERKGSVIKCKYVSRDGSVIKKSYRTSLADAKRVFQNYLNSNKLQ